MEKGKDRGGSKTSSGNSGHTPDCRRVPGVSGLMIYLRFILIPRRAGRFTSWEALRSSLQWGQDWLSGWHKAYKR